MVLTRCFGAPAAMLQQPRVPPTGQRQAIEIQIKWREVLEQKKSFLNILSKTTGHSVEKLEQVRSVWTHWGGRAPLLVKGPQTCWDVNAEHPSQHNRQLCGEAQNTQDLYYFTGVTGLLLWSGDLRFIGNTFLNILSRTSSHSVEKIEQLENWLKNLS
jgi:hypothetical protein